MLNKRFSIGIGAILLVFIIGSFGVLLAMKQVHAATPAAAHSVATATPDPYGCAGPVPGSAPIVGGDMIKPHLSGPIAFTAQDVRDFFAQHAKPGVSVTFDHIDFMTDRQVCDLLGGVEPALPINAMVCYVQITETLSSGDLSLGNKEDSYYILDAHTGNYLVYGAPKHTHP